MTENPFAPSQLDATADRRPKTVKTYVYKSAGWLTKAITILMCGCILLLVLFAVIQTAGHLKSPYFLDPNTDIEGAVLGRLFQTGLIVGGINLALQLAIACLVCWFMVRTNKNCRALGAENMKFTPGWCCGYWFIPIISWFRPYQAMKEIYKASVSPEGDTWTSVKRLAQFPFWWLGWLSGDMLEDAAELITDANVKFGALMISTAIKCMAGILLIQIVRRIVREQEKHAPRT